MRHLWYSVIKWNLGLSHFLILGLSTPNAMLRCLPILFFENYVSIVGNRLHILLYKNRKFILTNL